MHARTAAIGAAICIGLLAAKVRIRAKRSVAASYSRWDLLIDGYNGHSR
jgi:hypothetical protein